MLFLNGWNLGQYSAGIGPQTDFVFPAGVLHQQGDNTLALAVIAQGPAVLGPVSLVSEGSRRGGVAVSDVVAPGFDPQRNSLAEFWQLARQAGLHVSATVRQLSGSLVVVYRPT